MRKSAEPAVEWQAWNALPAKSPVVLIDTGMATRPGDACRVVTVANTGRAPLAHTASTILPLCMTSLAPSVTETGVAVLAAMGRAVPPANQPPTVVPPPTGVCLAPHA